MTTATATVALAPLPGQPPSTLALEALEQWRASGAVSADWFGQESASLLLWPPSSMAACWWPRTGRNCSSKTPHSWSATTTRPQSGIYSAGLRRRDDQARVIFGGIQSIYRRMDTLQQAGTFRYIIVDECHRVPPPSEAVDVRHRL